MSTGKTNKTIVKMIYTKNLTKKFTLVKTLHNYKTVYLIALLFFLNIISTNSFAYVNSFIQNPNDNSVYTTEDIIELVISTDTNNVNNINLSSLEKDFQILGQSRQVSHTIVNGKTKSEAQLIISIRAKKTGKLTIPAIKINSTQTKNINISVKEPSLDPRQKNAIFITTEAQNNQVYLQTALRVNVAINVEDELTVRNLELTSPKNKEINLYKIGESNNQYFHNDKRYTQYNIKYLVFYDKSGDNFLPQFVLSGVNLKDNPLSNNIFSLYQQQWKPFKKTSPKIPLKVLSPPNSFPSKTNWLSANSINITEKWSNMSSNIPIGEALQRTITITGENIPAHSLPVIYDPEKNYTSDQYKIYVDKPEQTTKVKNGQLHSVTEQKITYITTNTGQLKTNPISITYWKNNTNSNNITTAKLKSQTFNITTSLNTNTSTNHDINNKSTVQNSSNIDSINNNNNSNAISSNNSNIKKNLIVNTTDNNSSIKLDKTPNLADKSLTFSSTIFYFLISIIVILTIIIISLIIILKTPSYSTAFSNRKNKYRPTDNNNNSYLYKQLKKLKISAKHNNAQSTNQHLLNIASLIFASNDKNNPINNPISKLKDFLPIESQNNINNLLSNLYGINKNSWDSNYFYSKVIPIIKQLAKDKYTDNKNLDAYLVSNKLNKSKQKDSGLSELYPS